MIFQAYVFLQPGCPASAGGFPGELENEKAALHERGAAFVFDGSEGGVRTESIRQRGRRQAGETPERAARAARVPNAYAAASGTTPLPVSR